MKLDVEDMGSYRLVRRGGHLDGSIWELLDESIHPLQVIHHDRP